MLKNPLLLISTLYMVIIFFQFKMVSLIKLLLMVLMILVAIKNECVSGGETCATTADCCQNMYCHDRLLQCAPDN
jgi:hypothetical protein